MAENIKAEIFFNFRNVAAQFFFSLSLEPVFFLKMKKMRRAWVEILSLQLKLFLIFNTVSWKKVP